MKEFRDLTISAKPPQSTRDSSTTPTPTNSNCEKSISGMNPDIVSSNNRSVMPTDVQALTVLQDLLSDDFQVNADSISRKGEDEKEETSQLIQKIHNQLQQVQWDLQRLHSLHKYKN